MDSSSKAPVAVLQLLPSHDEAAQVACTIHTLSLNDPDSPRFKALSYCWGDAHKTNPILVGGKECQVTTNLEAALRNIRERDENVYLWVDAICINQGDIQERTRQVRMMPDIYKGAETVMVWLGNEADDSDFAMEKCTEWGSKHLDTESRHLFGVAIEKPFHERAWTAVGKLLERDYWSRRWVVQEVLLGTNVIVRCGRKETPWENFKGLDEAWYQVERKMDHLRGELRKEHLDMITNSHLTKLALFFNFQQERCLFPILRWTTSLECQDPRDRIFAMMGLVSDADTYSAPDYSKDMREVYTDFARTNIKSTGRLDILNEAASHLYGRKATNEEELPSWVPYWRVEAKAYMPYRHANNGGDLYRADFNKQWQSKDIVLFPDNLSAFRPLGVVCDKISKVSASSFLEIGYPAIISFITDDKNYTHPSNLPMLYVLFRTSVLDVDFRLSCRLSEVEKDIPTVFLQLAEGFLLNIALDYGFLLQGSIESLDDIRIPDYDLDFPFLEPGSEIAEQNPRFATFKSFREKIEEDAPFCYFMMDMFKRHVEHFTKDRPLFMTEKGYVGFSTSPDVKEGDILSVILGCSTPILLRETGNEEKFVSDAFIFGLMDGEAVGDEWLKSDEGKEALRRFCIR